jgi:hypothetical protein
MIIVITIVIINLITGRCFDHTASNVVVNDDDNASKNWLMVCEVAARGGCGERRQSQ